MYDRFRKLLFRLDAERAHDLGMAAAGLGKRFAPGYLQAQFAFEHAALQSTCLGIGFTNPVGLAAGFDKNARKLAFWPMLGFGFAEVGSVSADKSRGNPRPRAFRLEADQALINRMGLNNHGARRISRRLAEDVPNTPIPVGVNLAKTNDPAITGAAAVADYVQSFGLVAPHAAYVTLNISCPNTDEGRTFEMPDSLDALLGAVFRERTRLKLDVPVLVKLSPPFSSRVKFDSLLDQIIALCVSHGVHGFVASNTAPDRSDLETPPDVLAAIGSGGLSGAPIRARATHLVRYLYRKTEGSLPIIGVGGVDSPQAAYEKIRAGARLVQLYTGLVYRGPALVREIKEGLVGLLERDGFSSISEAVGVDA